MDEIRLVAIDLDGTTLRSDISLAEHTAETIEKATDAGIIVVPTTGRGFSEIPKELLNVSGVDYLITSNGARVMDLVNHENIYENPLKQEEVRLVMPYFKQFDLILEAYINGETIVLERCVDALDHFNIPGEYREFFHNTRRSIRDEAEFYNYIDQNSVEKFNLFFADPVHRDTLGSLLKAKTNMNVTFSLESNLEVNNPTSNKADGLNQLCKTLGIAQKQTMAIGDSNNDIEMLSYAGLSVAMANGVDRVKSIADYITTTNDEHGVAKAITRFVLENLKAS